MNAHARSQADAGAEIAADEPVVDVAASDMPRSVEKPDQKPSGLALHCMVLTVPPRSLTKELPPD